MEIAIFCNKHSNYQYNLFKLSFLENLQGTLVSGKGSFLNNPVCESDNIGTNIDELHAILGYIELYCDSKVAIGWMRPL